MCLFINHCVLKQDISLKMKVLRQINSVKVFECNDKDDNEITLMEFDSEPAYYKSVIRPMLTAGHEGELINWLKNVGLLQSSQRCNNIINDVCCQGVMNWVPANIVDHYQWKCKNCSKKRTIRENSVFQDIRCHFKDAIRILAGWCKGTDVDTMAKLLCIKKQAVNAVYNVAAEVATKYIKSNISLWKIGGPNVIVIIDTYPEGLSKLGNQENQRAGNIIPILCIAEVKEIPTRYWLQVLERYNSNSSEQIQNVNTTALQVIQEIVIQGSILVTNLNTKICSYDTLQSLKHLYPVIVSTEGLKRHDSMNELLNNLETIWKPGLDICGEAQFYTYSQMQNFITNELWRQRFGHEAFETLVNQMCYNSD